MSGKVSTEGEPPPPVLLHAPHPMCPLSCGRLFPLICLPPEIRLLHAGWVRGITKLGGRRFATASYDNRVGIWDLDDPVPRLLTPSDTA